MRKKIDLHLLYANAEQIHENCYIAQLCKVLSKHFKFILTSEAELVSGAYTRPKKGAFALSLLKQRTWKRLIPFLTHYAQDSGLIFYDQDPWEAYHDHASSPGVYKLLNELVNVRRYLVTSGWWADYIRKIDKLPVSFVRMGVYEKYCDVGQQFSRRPVELGFHGTVHAHRKAFFEYMQENGEAVTCLPSKPYREFLRSVQSIGIFIHDENADVRINNIMSLNGIWIKDIEVASRGCFAIRNSDLDAASYGIDELPTIFSYQNKEDIFSIINHIRQIPEKQKYEMMKHSVECIRNRNDWETVVDAIMKAHALEVAESV